MTPTLPFIDEIYTAKKPAIAVDVVLFTIKNNELHVGLTQREEEPFLGKYALPGRFVRYDEPIETTAKLALQLKGGINPDMVFFEQLYAFGQDLNRDTRIRTISLVYYALLNIEQLNKSGKNKFQWFSTYKLPQLAFDHKQIIDYALVNLREKIAHSAFAFQLMPQEFTLTQLQNAYETILDQKLDKRNFRKKILELHLLKDIKKQKSEGAHRPAALYSFIRKR